MIKFSALKPGDYVTVNFDGARSTGVVTLLNREDKEVCVQTDVQSYWFKPEDLEPITMDQQQLERMGFEREDNEAGVKYKKGAFRIQLSSEDQFDEFEIWYREDRRHIHGPIGVHELQNHYLQMTKVELA